MTQICRQLDKLGNNRFAHLSGSLPLPYPLNASSRELEIIFDYSQTANSSAFIKVREPGLTCKFVCYSATNWVDNLRFRRPKCLGNMALCGVSSRVNGHRSPIGSTKRMQTNRRS